MDRGLKEEGGEEMDKVERLFLAGLGALTKLRKEAEKYRDEIAAKKEKGEKELAKSKREKALGGYCACGCGQRVPEGRKWIQGHNLQAVRTKKKKKR